MSFLKEENLLVKKAMLNGSKTKESEIEFYSN
jgi:hypothetical protein